MKDLEIRRYPSDTEIPANNGDSSEESNNHGKKPSFNKSAKACCAALATAITIGGFSLGNKACENHLRQKGYEARNIMGQKVEISYTFTNYVGGGRDAVPDFYKFNIEIIKENGVYIVKTEFKDPYSLLYTHLSTFDTNNPNDAIKIILDKVKNKLPNNYKHNEWNEFVSKVRDAFGKFQDNKSKTIEWSDALKMYENHLKDK